PPSVRVTDSMSSRRRKPYSGCSVDAVGGKLRFRYRRSFAGQKTKRCAILTGLDDTPENRVRLEALAESVGQALKRGIDIRPVLAGCMGRDASGTVVVTPPLTVASYVDKFIAYQTPLVRKAQARDYRRHLTGYVVPRLGKVPLAS